MRAKAFAIAALAVLVASVVVPVSTNAAFTDSVFIIGKWNFEETRTEGDDSYSYTHSLRFDIGGGGKAIYETESEDDGYASEGKSESEFDWKIEGGILYIYPINYIAGDPDWDAASQFKFEYDNVYRTLKLYAKNAWTGTFETEATEYTKSGDICGVACPCCFMYFAVAPLTLVAAVAFRRFKR